MPDTDTANIRLGTLQPLDGKTWLSWNDAKRQIRTMIRKSGHKALGTFRPRKVNGQELQIATSAGTATAGRWIGAPVLIVTGP